MFIWKDTLKRCNIYAPYVDNKGTKYTQVPSDLYVEIDNPIPPEDYVEEHYYKTEQEDAPYVVYTKKSEEQLAEIYLRKAKAEREEAVRNIIVTTQSGKKFNGDEEAQSRMSRAILAMDPLETTLWVLADSVVDPAVSREELREALRLAGAAQTAVWATPYTK